MVALQKSEEKLARECRKKLNELYNIRESSDFFYVPEHQGILDNNKTDC